MTQWTQTTAHGSKSRAFGSVCHGVGAQKGFLVAEAAGRDSEKEQLGTNLRLFEAISSHSRHHMASLAPIGSWVATCQIVPGGRAYWELYHLRHPSIAQKNKKQHKIFQWGIISKPTSYTFLISNWVL